MRSSNSPRYFEPATIDDRSRETSFLPRRESGTSPSTMRRASPSTTAVLPTPGSPISTGRSEEHTSELQSRGHLVCRLLLEKKKDVMKKWNIVEITINIIIN